MSGEADTTVVEKKVAVGQEGQATPENESQQQPQATGEGSGTGNEEEGQVQPAAQPDPVAEAKAEASRARTEAEAAKAEAEVLRRALANPVPPAPVQPQVAPAMTDEQKLKIEDEYGMPYDKLEKLGTLVQRIVSRETVSTTRERTVSAMREKYGATFLNHEKAFREALSSVSPDVSLNDQQADDLFGYVYGRETLKSASARPAGQPAVQTSPSGRQIVGGTGIEGTQAVPTPKLQGGQVRLSDEEKFVASRMGISYEDYMKSKEKNRAR